MDSFDERTIRFLHNFGQQLEAHRAGSTKGHPAYLPALDESNFSTVWALAIQEDFQELKVPESEWVTGGMLYLPDEIRLVSTRRRESYEKENRTDWTWDQFIIGVQAVLEELARVRKMIKGAALGVVLGPPIIVGGLGLLGFGAAGVAAGSAAATIQSALYGGATTGLFSICQAIGATGAVGSTGVAISGAVGAMASKFFPSNRR